MKDSAISFLKLAASGDVAEAYSKFVGAGFVHHNPYFAAGADSLREAMRENAAENPDKSFEVQRAIGEGDLVAVHSKITFATKAMVVSVIHIFRFSEGKIVEAWDIGQVVPDQMPNESGMF